MIVVNRSETNRDSLCFGCHHAREYHRLGGKKGCIVRVADTIAIGGQQIIINRRCACPRWIKGGN